MRTSPALRVLRDDQVEAMFDLELDTAPADHRERWEPRCIMCDRPRSTHGTPVEYGGETIIPTCELLHPGGLLPEGPPPPPGPRPLSRLLELSFSMRLFDAKAIVGSLGEPSKMPGAAYGLDAWQCKVGSVLAELPGSTCSSCYARRNFYKYYYTARSARARRQAAIHHPLWDVAMVVVLRDYMRTTDLAGIAKPVFRWHDSGDLDSLDHLEKIVGIARCTRRLRHWLPTREYGVVAQFVREGGVVPPNLTIRLSAHYNDRLPALPPELRGFPISTTHTTRPPRSERPTVVCRASTRENRCGGCRACWSKVDAVSYPLH